MSDFRRSIRAANVHWKALSTTIGAFIIGFLLALGHHCYYQSLEGTTVSIRDTSALIKWSGVSSQKLHTAVGTAFSSLFRTFLAVAVTTAYVQIVWKALKGHRTSLTTADSITGVLKNPLAFFHVAAWRRHYLLFFAAAVAWLVPISSVITPATLSVETDLTYSSALLNVSSIDFNSLNFAEIVSNSQGHCGYVYTGPEPAVTRIVSAVVGQGAVLPVAAPLSQPNTSYVKTFAGPTLSCGDVPQALQEDFNININASTFHNKVSYGYLAWVPDPYIKNAAPFVDKKPLGNQGPLTIYLAAFPGMNNVYVESGYPKFSTINATFTQCRLVNTTYSVTYNWTNGVLDMDVSTNGFGDPMLGIGGIDCENYLSVSGAAQLDSGDLSTYNNTIVQIFAYQSVMDAFGRILAGTLSNDRESRGTIIESRTSIMDTILGEVEELAFLSQGFVEGAQTLKSFAGTGIWPGVSMPTKTTSVMSLRDALEGLFQNITLSLMSSSYLQPDPATPYYPEPVNVTFATSFNRYAYSAPMLWLAYGIAIAMVAVPIYIACFAIFAADVSYADSFSTIIRTAAHAKISAVITKADGVGQEPLPKHLREATIAFHAGGTEMKDGEDGEVDNSTKNMMVHSRLLSHESQETRETE